MSVTENIVVACPHCSAPAELLLVRSLNAQRHPELKQALLDGEMNRCPCSACGADFVVEAEVTYFDAERRQLLGGFPLADLTRARECAEEVMAGYERWICLDAPPAMRRQADRYLVRACFGYDELREKVVIDDAGLSDVCVEALKCILLVTLSQEVEARPVTFWVQAIDDEALWLAPDHGVGADAAGRLRAPRALYAAIASRRSEILELCPGLASGPHVSLLRLADWSPALGQSLAELARERVSPTT